MTGSVVAGFAAVGAELGPGVAEVRCAPACCEGPGEAVCVARCCEAAGECFAPEAVPAVGAG